MVGSLVLQALGGGVVRPDLCPAPRVLWVWRRNVSGAILFPWRLCSRELNGSSEGKGSHHLLLAAITCQCPPAPHLKAGVGATVACAFLE